MKSLITIIILLITTTATAAEKRIGVLMWTSENHYQTTLEEAKKELERQGLKINYDIQFANGNKMKAREIAQDFANKNLDAVMPVGTSAALIIGQEIKTKPIVFGQIFDPVTAGVVKIWGANGENVTGASAYIHASYTIKKLQALCGAKRIGVLYQPGEKNSEAIVKNLRAVEQSAGVKIIPVPVTSKESLMTMLPNLEGAMDALYIAGSSIIGENLAYVANMATRSRIVTVGHIEAYLEKGVALVVYPPAAENGKQTGVLMAQVLKGKNPGTLPIWQIKSPAVGVNMQTIKAGELKINNINPTRTLE